MYDPEKLLTNSVDSKKQMAHSVDIGCYNLDPLKLCHLSHMTIRNSFWVFQLQK